MEDEAAIALEMLNGEFVRELRIEGISKLTTGFALRYSDPVKSDALILLGMQLKEHADRIEWLATKYLTLGEEVEFWTRLAESPHTFVERIIGVRNPQ